MKLSHIRDVVAVAQFGSLRAAGRHLGVAQPAITRSIREIEQELGISLFERHAKGVHLTTMGAAFVRRASSVQTELRRAKEEIDQMKGRATGEVSMGMSPASVISLMPAALTEFRKHYPDAVLKISESLFQPIEAELLDGEMDFWVGPIDRSFSSGQLVVERLFENYRVVLARKGHPLASATSLKDLHAAKWVRPTLSARNTEGDFDAMFERLGYPPPQIVLHARSTLITFLAVANSDLLTVLPRQWLSLPGSSGIIDALTLTETMIAAPIAIVRRQDLPLTPMAEHLCDVVRRAATHYAHRENVVLERVA